MEHPEGVVAVVGGIVFFIGSVYLLVSLNVGWRFGYWVTMASMGGLMLFMSVFWVVTEDGPRGEEARWLPIGVSEEPVQQATFDELTFTEPGRYPGGGWEQPSEEGGLAEQRDPFDSAMSNCLTAKPEGLPTSTEQQTCEQAQQLLPQEEQVPLVEGMRVVVTHDLADIRFAEEEGWQLGQAQVTTITRDPRVTDPEEGMVIGEPFHVLGMRDPGRAHVPGLLYMLGSIVFFAFHLWGLNRSERRKLSHVTA